MKLIQDNLKRAHVFKKLIHENVTMILKILSGIYNNNKYKNFLIFKV